jgi:hypothetical protein
VILRVHPVDPGPGFCLCDFLPDCGPPGSVLSNRLPLRGVYNSAIIIPSHRAGTTSSLVIIALLGRTRR